MSAKIKRNICRMKDPGSAITHLIAMVSAAIAAVPLLIKAAKTPGYLHLAALAVFILSMICLYGASTLYHTLNISPVINKRLRKLDHMMIFVLIAGTYPGMPDRFRRSHRLEPFRPCMGHCPCWNHHQCPVDHLP